MHKNQIITIVRIEGIVIELHTICNDENYVTTLKIVHLN